MSEITQLVHSPGWWFTTVIMGILVGVVSGLMVAKPLVFLPTVRWAEAIIIVYAFMILVVSIIGASIVGFPEQLDLINLRPELFSPFWRGVGLVCSIGFIGFMLPMLMYISPQPITFKIGTSLAILIVNGLLALAFLADPAVSYRIAALAFLHLAFIILMFGFVFAGATYVTVNAVKWFAKLIWR